MTRITKNSQITSKLIQDIDNNFSAEAAKADDYLLSLSEFGRPKKGTKKDTIQKALRLPVEIYGALHQRADKLGISDHAAMRIAIAEWSKY
jgi:hypothetical protein